MPGGTARIERMTRPTDEPALPREIRLGKSVLITGIGGAIFCSLLAAFLVVDFLRSGVPRHPPFYFVVGGVSFMSLMTLGGLYLTLAWCRESLLVTERGFVWHELFRTREAHWTEVRKAEWSWDNQAGRVKLHLEGRRIMLAFSQFARPDRRWLMNLIRDRVPPGCQTGWERLEQIWERQKRSPEPVRNGNRWLFVAALVGFVFTLIFCLKSRTHIPKTLFALCGTFGMLVCPVVLVTSAWDLIRFKPTHWLASALTVSLMNCILMAAGMLTLIRHF